jgi:hypothetical protein
VVVEADSWTDDPFQIDGACAMAARGRGACHPRRERGRGRLGVLWDPGLPCYRLAGGGLASPSGSLRKLGRPTTSRAKKSAAATSAQPIAVLAAPD